MKISTFFYTIRQGFVNIFRNKWYSLASIATISACLFLFGLLYTITANFQSMVLAAEKNVSVTVFFHDPNDRCDKHGAPHTPEQVPSEQRIGEIGQKIANRVEVSDVQFVSDEEAWKNHAPKLYGEEYEEGFLENPLAGMDSYKIYLSDVSMQDALVSWLKSIPEVRKVNYSANTAYALSGVNLLIAYISVSIVAILLGVSVFLISNTVAVGISVRATEINVMKYIGATDFFVRAPFVLEGVLIGLMGAAIPLGILYGLYVYVRDYLVTEFSILSNFLLFLSTDQLFGVLVPISLALGGGIGFVGSAATVKKHLHV